ncbi:MAG: amidohydrolase family protein [Lachnospiraceae bacterium]|nr:amidohydrolase family protein [Lachnospiraceae bacterium]
MIIDFHTHTFPDKVALKAIDAMSLEAGIRHQTDGTVSGLASSMRQHGIDLSLNLPVATRADQVSKINENMIASQEDLRSMGIVTFGAMHPDCPDCRQQLRLLVDHGIRGIKLHPAYQNTDLNDIRMMRILDAASELDLMVTIHAGLDIGIPHHDFASINMINEVIDAVHPTGFILAHMGNWGAWDRVESDLCGAPVWMDTAFALGPMDVREDAHRLPDPDHNMDADQFVRIVRKHGADKILFATDSPWERPAVYRNFIEESQLTEDEKKLIFSENAKKILRI